VKKIRKNLVKERGCHPETQRRVYKIESLILSQPSLTIGELTKIYRHLEGPLI